MGVPYPTNRRLRVIPTPSSRIPPLMSPSGRAPTPASRRRPCYYVLYPTVLYGALMGSSAASSPAPAWNMDPAPPGPTPAPVPRRLPMPPTAAPPPAPDAPNAPNPPAAPALALAFFCSTTASKGRPSRCHEDADDDELMLGSVSVGSTVSPAPILFPVEVTAGGVHVKSACSAGCRGSKTWMGPVDEHTARMTRG